ncbi:MAG TPA: hypothetical protein VFD17_07350, partial [Clostridia bacterium]|nr:hypothetical protein [Clostridia bacterium]
MGKNLINLEKPAGTVQPVSLFDRGDCPHGFSSRILKGGKKPMKKYAAIDIGTNSMRLLLA